MKGQDGKTGQLGQNLLKNSKETFLNSNQVVAEYDLAESLITGEQVTVTVKGSPEPDRKFQVYNSSTQTWLATLEKDDSKTDIYTATFNWRNVSPNNRLLLAVSPQTSNLARVEWAVLARGDIPANDWYASHEEIQQALAEKASQQEYIDTNTIVNQMADKVRDLDTSLEITQESAMIKHSSEYVNTISRLLQNVNDANDTIEKLTQELETVHTYFEFADALTIGKSNSQAKIQIDNELIKFLEGQSVGTFIDRNTLNTSNIYVGNLIELVNHTIETQGNKTIFRYNHNRRGGV